MQRFSVLIRAEDFQEGKAGVDRTVKITHFTPMCFSKADANSSKSLRLVALPIERLDLYAPLEGFSSVLLSSGLLT
jgi:hypothetical protein